MEEQLHGPLVLYYAQDFFQKFNDISNSGIIDVKRPVMVLFSPQKLTIPFLIHGGQAVIPALSKARGASTPVPDLNLSLWNELWFTPLLVRHVEKLKLFLIFRRNPVDNLKIDITPFFPVMKLATKTPRHEGFLIKKYSLVSLCLCGYNHVAP
jgi:hypothetical protein